MNGGRIFCVTFPFISTVLAIVLLLVSILGGKHVPSLWMFEVDLRELQIDPRGLTNIIKDILPRQVDVNDVLDTIDNLNLPNITATDIGLDNVYRINMWGYCSGKDTNDMNCINPTFDWAATTLNTTFLDNVGAVAGRQIDLPKEIEDGLNVFKTASKWLQIVSVIALGLLGLELLFGLFSGCSRGWSCAASIVASVATLFTVATAILATVMATAVIGVVKASAEIYGVKGNVNTQFLIVIWVAVAFAVAAGIFWSFSICCCKPGSRDSKRYLDDSPYQSRSYQPVTENHSSGYNSGFSQGYSQQPYKPAASYEPYATSRV